MKISKKRKKEFQTCLNKTLPQEKKVVLMNNKIIINLKYIKNKQNQNMMTISMNTIKNIHSKLEETKTQMKKLQKPKNQ